MYLVYPDLKHPMPMFNLLNSKFGQFKVIVDFTAFIHSTRRIISFAHTTIHFDFHFIAVPCWQAIWNMGSEWSFLTTC